MAHDADTARLRSLVPLCGNRSVSALVVVPGGGVLRSAAAGGYSSLVWNVLEYLALFAIVLLHEFGHALACRQVGGKANQIVLWPLGGVAYVAPPPRPGATLWSIAAGPLVNVALAPVLIGALFAELAARLGEDNARMPTRSFRPSGSSTACCWSSTCCRFIRSTAARSCAPCCGSCSAARAA